MENHKLIDEIYEYSCGVLIISIFATKIHEHLGWSILLSILVAFGILIVSGFIFIALSQLIFRKSIVGSYFGVVIVVIAAILTLIFL